VTEEKRESELVGFGYIDLQDVLLTRQILISLTSRSPLPVILKLAEFSPFSIMASPSVVLKTMASYKIGVENFSAQEKNERNNRTDRK